MCDAKGLDKGAIAQFWIAYPDTDSSADDNEALARFALIMPAGYVR